MALVIALPDIAKDLNAGSSQLVDGQDLKSSFTNISTIFVNKKSNSTDRSSENKKDNLIVEITNNNNTIPENELLDAWLRITLELAKDKTDDKWIHKSITKAERYMVPLYNNEEYRNFITTYLMVIRNNSGVLTANSPVRDVLAKSIAKYSISSRKADDRMQFIRSLRSVGVSPIGL